LRNESYDLIYNNKISPEDQDKVSLDILSTHKFKETVKYCLKEELVNSFKMDDFFKKQDNKINFMYDNYYVPHMRNKLYVQNGNKVRKILVLEHYNSQI
jgi:phage pi2 protein 07